MAIAKIKKIELLGLNKDKERLLFSLQNLGRVELINIRQQDSRIGLQSVSYDINLAGLEEAITGCGKY
jgi:hypothetical protein